MARPIWKGHISFGLVSMPVELHSAESRADVSFHLVDSRNAARVQYERVNSETGEEVPWDKIVKGYEYSDGSYVLMSDEEMERANVEMTRTIEIDQFVDASTIDIRYFEKPYIIVPGKGGEKGYVLLREAISRQGAAGIATIVIRARQHLAAVLTSGDALILEMLRYPQELRDAKDHSIPAGGYRKYKVTEKEITLASQLVKGMSGEWKPAGYHDEYRDALMKLIQRKIKSGKTEEIEDVEEDDPDEEPGTINFMDVLKRSVERAGKAPKRAKKSPRKKAAKKASTKKRTTRRRTAKKKAG
jgi:DNA end-binding protein Ku